MQGGPGEEEEEVDASKPKRGVVILK